MASSQDPSISDSPLHVLIVGGGLSGLATAISVSLAGHRATVFEAAPQPHPFGSGVMTCPNGTRLLSRWGVDDGIPETASHVAISRWQLRDHQGTKRLAPDLMVRDGGWEDNGMYQEYSPPPWTFHRVRLQAALLRRAQEVGATVRFGSRVVGVDDDDGEDATIQLESGETLHGDLVVVAEGTQSRLRNLMLDRSVNPTATGYMAYRVTVDRTLVRDLELLDFMDMTYIRTWIGNGSYVSVFPMEGAAQLSMMVSIPRGQLQQDTTATPGQELKAYFKDWDGLLSSMVDAAQRVNKWAAVHLPEPPKRHSPQGRCVLVGDAANSTSPIISQGLSLGLEDAAVLGHLLSHVHSKSQVPAATQLYAKMRDARTQLIQEGKARALHATDGGCSNDGENSKQGAGSCLNFKNEMVVQTWMWHYDAYAEAEYEFKSTPF
ncbi:hypothetical protein PG990_009043 [Apiospora arundinis]